MTSLMDGTHRERDGAGLTHLQALTGGTSRAAVAPPSRPTARLAIECASIGAVLGATLGVLAATLLATVSVTLLGVGIAGPLAAAFIGAIGGAGGGALVGAAFDAGVVSRRARSNVETPHCRHDPAPPPSAVAERAP